MWPSYVFYVAFEFLFLNMIFSIRIKIEGLSYVLRSKTKYVFFEKMTGRRNGEKLTEVFELENENIEIIRILLSFLYN